MFGTQWQMTYLPNVVGQHNTINPCRLYQEYYAQPGVD